jgi:hypothetical protein
VWPPPSKRGQRVSARCNDQDTISNRLCEMIDEHHVTQGLVEAVQSPALLCHYAASLIASGCLRLGLRHQGTRDAWMPRPLATPSLEVSYANHTTITPWLQNCVSGRVRDLRDEVKLVPVRSFKFPHGFPNSDTIKVHQEQGCEGYCGLCQYRECNVLSNGD